MKVFLKKTLMAPEGPFDLHVDLEIEDGECISLFGRSGCGKTSILRMIAGLQEPQEGLVRVGGKVWFDSARKIDLPPQKRATGFVFQEYSLFPNMTVEENLRFALCRGEETACVGEYLGLVGLKGLEQRYPSKLSGGQKQRVALARALLRHPKILLLDEPLSALDVQTRWRLQDEVLRLYEKTGITMILVSHDPFEVMKLSGRVFMLEAGRIVRSGEPQDVFCGSEWETLFRLAKNGRRPDNGF
jgi:molybdate transport system ATP-binding protein